MNGLLSRALAVAGLALVSCAPSVHVQTPPTPPAVPPETRPRAPSYVMRETPDAPSRAHAPPVADAPPPFTPPPIRSFRLANGVPVLFLERRTPSFLRVEVMLRAQPAPFGANLMAARSLVLGSQLSWANLDAANDIEGSVMTSEYSWGWFRVGITATRDRTASSVARLASVVLRAALPAGGYLQHALNIMSELEPSDDAPDAIATRLQPLVLYAPSATRVEDDVKDLRSADLSVLWREQVAAAYEGALQPSSAAIVVAGDSTVETLKPLLEKAFGGWHAKSSKSVSDRQPRPPATKPALATSSPRLVVVDRPEAESRIVFVGEGPSYSAAEWTAVSALYGLYAGPKGRIASAFRSASVDPASGTLGLQANPLAPRITLRARVPVAQTAPALRALDELLRETKTAAITSEELAHARRLHVIGLQAQTATVAGAVGELEGLVVQGLSPGDVLERPARFAALTPADLQRSAARYLDPAHMKVVVVGDWSKMRPQVEALGWGPVELRDAAGKVASARAAEAPR